ncbi:acyl carrier protein [Schleiferia thermophila]|jgi:acyl carrier protein|uniref:Acyl carrier protein n=1 Tax=Schleiferia thermophila TaxID=884107 RepID=A0A369A8L4_9FLAO|nr:acyl carrier protein [Schleiferia thermophila]KFD40158.1 acyl carrier protein [Schleiferia thermophila str. Yellowstone]RCX05700.1 acyl carrier protein [Schleiferia thermophila]GCD78811.1 acyl carrier protein [Schleiferia thermophila]
MESKLLEIFNVVLRNRGRSEVSQLTENTHLRSDLGLDSLDLAELTVRIESEYGIDIFEEGIVNTVGEIVNKLNALK